MPLRHQLTAKFKPSPVLNAKALTFRPAAVINALLLALCGVVVLYYVIWSNALAANDYKVSALHGQLAQLTQTNSALSARELSMEDPIALQKFAAEHGMVPAKDPLYVFENGNVALQR